MRMVPLPLRQSPASARNSELLPQPLGPTISSRASGGSCIESPRKSTRDGSSGGKSASSCVSSDTVSSSTTLISAPTACSLASPVLITLETTDAVSSCCSTSTSFASPASVALVLMRLRSLRSLRSRRSRRRARFAGSANGLGRSGEVRDSRNSINSPRRSRPADILDTSSKRMTMKERSRSTELNAAHACCRLPVEVWPAK
mmetsp:Transcript_295/g.767  ORF Transcript_295/g.767 Transcript_295/m.767 type:complete len:202 (-) Transcript_295:989-1594(-)